MCLHSVINLQQCLSSLTAVQNSTKGSYRDKRNQVVYSEDFLGWFFLFWHLAFHVFCFIGVLAGSSKCHTESSVVSWIRSHWCCVQLMKLRYCLWSSIKSFHTVLPWVIFPWALHQLDTKWKLLNNKEDLRHILLGVCYYMFINRKAQMTWDQFCPSQHLKSLRSHKSQSKVTMNP